MSFAQTLELASGRIHRAAPHHAAAGAGITLDLVETADALQALAPEWDALFERAGRPTQVFQTHAFAQAWARCYLDGGRTRLAIVTVRQDGRLTLICPFVVQRSLGLDLLAWLGAPIAQYGDVLLEPGADATAVLGAAWAHVRSHVRPDAVRLRKVRADATVAPLLATIGEFQCGHEAAASVALGARSIDGTATSSFEDRQSSKARKNRRRLLRRLEEQGCVGFEALEPSQLAVERARAGLTMKRAWLDARGLYSAAFADRRIERFFETATADRCPDAGCRVFALTLDGAPIAVAIGFEAHRRLTLHLIAYDLAHEKAGAGVLNLEAVLRWAEARGLADVDLLAPKADYKMDWADATAAVCDHAAATSLPGKIYILALERMLKPLAKTLLARGPSALARQLARRGR